MKKLFFALPAVLLLLLSCSKEPTTFDELKSAGETAFVKLQFSQARQYLNDAVRLKPNDRRTLYLLGMSYAKDFLLDSAFSFLKRADILYPGDREISQALYLIAPDIREWGSAIKAMAVLVNTGDDPIKYYPEFIQFAEADSAFMQAHYYYRKFMQADSLNPDRYLAYARSAQRVDSIDVAIATMDAATERFGPKQEFYLNKGYFLTAKGETGKAEALFRELVTTSPENVSYQWNLANLLSSGDNRKRKEEALRIYTKIADRIDPNLRADSVITALRTELGIKK